MNPLAASALSGVLWSVPALILSASSVEPFPSSEFVAVAISGPFIGIGVYVFSLPMYGSSKGSRIAWSMATVYFSGAALLAASRFAESPSLFAINDGFTMMAGGFMWLLLIPPAWLIFAAAYANHEWLRRLSGYHEAPSS